MTMLFKGLMALYNVLKIGSTLFNVAGPLQVGAEGFVHEAGAPVILKHGNQYLPAIWLMSASGVEWWGGSDTLFGSSFYVSQGDLPQVVYLLTSNEIEVV